jgi:uncharacterized protein
MRLDAKELDLIIRAFQKCFSPGDNLWLFGSRVDDTKRSGDIDLYIEVENYDLQQIIQARSCFSCLLHDLLGEQKIDMVIRDPNQDLLIYQIARQEGIKLPLDRP